MTKPENPGKPDKAEPVQPEHPVKPPHPATPGVVELELTVVESAPAPTKRTTPKKSDGPLLHITCLVCGDTADSRDRKLIMRAADIHARTAHGDARARVRPAQDLDA